MRMHAATAMTAQGEAIRGHKGVVVRCSVLALCIFPSKLVPKDRRSCPSLLWRRASEEHSVHALHLQHNPTRPLRSNKPASLAKSKTPCISPAILARRTALRRRLRIQQPRQLTPSRRPSVKAAPAVGRSPSAAATATSGSSTTSASVEPSKVSSKSGTHEACSHNLLKTMPEGAMRSSSPSWWRPLATALSLNIFGRDRLSLANVTIVRRQHHYRNGPCDCFAFADEMGGGERMAVSHLEEAAIYGSFGCT
jgi:hypothetical protein